MTSSKSRAGWTSSSPLCYCTAFLLLEHLKHLQVLPFPLGALMAGPLSVCLLQGHRGHATDPLTGAAAAGAALAGHHPGREAGPAHWPAGCRRLPGLRSLGLHDRPQPGHRGWPEPVVMCPAVPPLTAFGKCVLELSLAPALACVATWPANTKLLLPSFGY